MKERDERPKFIIRFPLPYKVDGPKSAGNADEKLRCEVATYIWIQDHCPDIPIPRLRGFGFSSGQTFTALDNVPLYSRVFAIPPLKTGYLLLDYIDRTEATMLSESWETHGHDQGRRMALFKGLSRILLSLSQTPLPRLGSFTINDQGVVSLSNRPLTLRLHQMESEGIPPAITPRTKTYTSTELYLLDLLAGQDQRLAHQLNAINSESDCKAQMAALTGVRATLHHFLDRDQSAGPFYLTFTDTHQSNIFVDHDWNIKYLIDLEWACALPWQLQRVPYYWLTSKSVDSLLQEREPRGIQPGARGVYVGL
ncbi:hypothetical protein DV735_g5580, partial [Chaetothyriales sp. CBS 134920]